MISKPAMAVPIFSTTAVSCLFLFVVVGRSTSTLGNLNLTTSPTALTEAATDYGHIVTRTPAAVLYPSTVQDIVDLINSTYNNLSASATRSTSYGSIAARGRGHSVGGQAMAGADGVVVNMGSLRRNGSGVAVSGDESSGYYADVEGEVTWIEVLNATVERGLAPVSWTDYLYLSVGGTLSNAGIGGQTFRYGPQINNVYQLDVITGKAEFLTCSRESNSDLFYAVLGGLGQFGIITRARIVLEPAPKMVKWAKMIYTNFSVFTRDQEYLISIRTKNHEHYLNYVEGSFLLEQNPDISFFPPSDQPKIMSLINQYGILYCIEVVKNYDDHDNLIPIINKDFYNVMRRLSFEQGLMYAKDAFYVEFLNRVYAQELILRSQGLWDIAHPWLNLFIPKSQIMDFHDGVIQGIILKRNVTSGLVLFYPMHKNKWDEQMSAVTPDEDVFYTMGILQGSGFDDWKKYDDQNKDILEYCNKPVGIGIGIGFGIKIKEYLPHYTTKREWMDHFGSKWQTFQERKLLFDPKLLLSPGQNIFSNN